MSKRININNILTEIEEHPIKEGIIFKKRILSISKRDSNIIKNNFSFKNMKKNFSKKFYEQNIKNNETFNESIIPLNSFRKKGLFYKKHIHSPTTDRNKDINEKEKITSPNTNSKFKYHKKLNIKSPKIILNLPEKENIIYNGHISPRIPKIIFQNDLSQFQRKTMRPNPVEKNFNYKKYNKIIINNIFDFHNKEKENDMNNMNNTNIINKNKKKSIKNIPKNKNNLNKRNINYSKQITHFALKKGKNNNYIPQNTYQNYEKDKYNISLGVYSPRNNINNNNISTRNSIKQYYKISNNNICQSNNSNINNITQNKEKPITKISLKHCLNNNKLNKYNFDNLDINSDNNNKTKKLFTQEIRIKNSKLIDYMKKSKSKEKEEKINSSLNNLNLNINKSLDKYGKRKRNLSFNIFNSYNADSNPLLFSNDDSNTNNNNITFLSNGSIFSNNNISEKRVIFNRKIDYKKNKYNNGDYLELAKICANQEKIISDLVKNVHNLNNQICDKDLCINELNNQLYSIKYDLLNTLQKTNGKS